MSNRNNKWLGHTIAHVPFGADAVEGIREIMDKCNRWAQSSQFEGGKLTLRIFEDYVPKADVEALLAVGCTVSGFNPVIEVASLDDYAEIPHKALPAVGDGKTYLQLTDVGHEYFNPSGLSVQEILAMPHLSMITWLEYKAMYEAHIESIIGEI